MNTFNDLLQARVARNPQDVAYRFFRASRREPDVLTYEALWNRSTALAVELRSRGLTNKPALVICKSQQEFVIAFFGCLLAGAIAVPSAPPGRSPLVGRLRNIMADAGAGVVLTDLDNLRIEELSPEKSGLSALDIRIAGCPQPWTDPLEWPNEATADSIAFLQYTSGSTGDPKGVAVSHGNLMSNCAVIEEAMGLTPGSTSFTPLPMFHDMGLVGGVLQAIYTGYPGAFMPPADCVQYPERWLQIISEWGITVSGGPNFLYELAATTITDDQLEGLDLSRWRVAFCGAEPVRASTMARFAARFHRLGFAAESLYPCYGMAESTLFISGPELAAPLRVVRSKEQLVVSCGRAVRDTRIEIVDPDSCRPLPQGSTGEIWVSGGSVAQGYWKRPELTHRVFRGCIQGDDSGRFLRTGDLGFIRDGQLYVSGRLKDLIICNGRKYAPQDLEEEAERSHAAVRPSGGAAFSVLENEAEHVVIVLELRREWIRRSSEWGSVSAAVRAAIHAFVGLTLNDVVLIKPGALPRTSSGKIRRSQCQADYVASRIERLSMDHDFELSTIMQ